jgi:hypothetical protein
MMSTATRTTNTVQAILIRAAMLKLIVADKLCSNSLRVNLRVRVGRCVCCGVAYFISPAVINVYVGRQDTCLKQRRS